MGMKKHLQTHCPFHFPVSIFKQQITSFFILSYILCDTDKGHKILQGNQRHRKRENTVKKAKGKLIVGRKMQSGT